MPSDSGQRRWARGMEVAMCVLRKRLQTADIGSGEGLSIKLRCSSL